MVHQEIEADSIDQAEEEKHNTQEERKLVHKLERKETVDEVVQANIGEVGDVSLEKHLEQATRDKTKFSDKRTNLISKDPVEDPFKDAYKYYCLRNAEEKERGQVPNR